MIKESVCCVRYSEMQKKKRQQLNVIRYSWTALHARGVKHKERDVRTRMRGYAPASAVHAERKERHYIMSNLEWVGLCVRARVCVAQCCCYPVSVSNCSSSSLHADCVSKQWRTLLNGYPVTNASPFSESLSITFSVFQSILRLPEFLFGLTYDRRDFAFFSILWFVFRLYRPLISSPPNRTSLHITILMYVIFCLY